MKILSFLISDGVKIDEKTRKMTIEGIFNNINATKFPTRHPKMVVSLVLEGGAGKHHVSIFIEKEGQQVAGFSGDIEMREGRHYHVATFNDVIFPEEGKYEVRASVGELSIAMDLKLIKTINNHEITRV